MENPVTECARQALRELMKDEPVGVRITSAADRLKPVKPVLFSPYDKAQEEIMEEIKQALDTNYTLPERAQHIAEAITLIFMFCRCSY